MLRRQVSPGAPFANKAPLRIRRWSKHSAAVALLCLAACTAKPATIQFVRLPSSSPETSAPAVADERIERYQRSLAEVVGALVEALDLPRLDIVLVLFPDRRTFRVGLEQIGYPADLARSASAFNGIGGARAVLLNAGVVDRFDRARRVRLLAHELTHSLQYQFGGGTRGASEQWLREGFAEWVACRVTAHLRLGSYESLKSDVLAPLAGARLGTTPAPLDRLVTFPQWVDAQQRHEAPLYAQAFIAAELLVELAGVPAMLDYFGRFRQTSDYEGAFAQSFGMDRRAFERLLVPRWHQTVALYRTGP